MSSGQITNAAFADALNRARQLAAKIGSGEKRPLEDGEGNAAKRPNNDGAPISTLGVVPSGMDPVIVEQYKVPDHMVGLIIGRGGEQITNIQTVSQCRVQMAPDSNGLPERQCTLTGTKIAIERAKELINAIVAKGGGPPMVQSHAQGGGGQVIEELLIPGSKVGLVIGKGGENLKKIQEQLNVRMIVIQESNSATMQDKPLRIIGAPDKVDIAKQKVIELMNSKDDSGRFGGHGGGGGGGGYNDYGSGGGQKSLGEVIVPRIAVGVIIGKQGEMIKKIQNESGAKVQFKLGEDTNGPERTAVLTGMPDQIQKATSMITELVQQAIAKAGGNMPMGGGGGQGMHQGGMGGGGGGGMQRQEIFYMHVPSNKTGLVIGKGGETIRQINTESGAHVELSRETPPNEYEKIFIIKGSAQAIHHAQHLIRIKVGDIPPGTPVPPFPGNAYGGGPGPQPQPAPVQPPQPQPQPAPQPAPAQDPNAAAWAAYYAQYYQQANVYPGQGQPGGHQQAGAPQSAPVQPAVTAQSVQSSVSAAPAVNPVTGQPDYSAQWAEYYRSLGMHDQAALIEQQAKANQAAAAVAAAAGHPQQHQGGQPVSQQPTYAAYGQQQPQYGIPGQQYAGQY